MPASGNHGRFAAQQFPFTSASVVESNPKRVADCGDLCRTIPSCCEILHIHKDFLLYVCYVYILDTSLTQCVYKYVSPERRRQIEVRVRWK